ncbi:CpsD/CapB family tyrosine-protein kinase [uncultured Senegalimassilia sp.]|uniref:CpsD/CapB family tyrosine-protein kinase n=1 Tax=uncultured Senegalimassilia sp. TaxID=1714350 RepID=UPI002583D983|nr:CpsD/CapB family tyrosine-protein kinase [uncultured Senegalimassilia sp.]
MARKPKRGDDLEMQNAAKTLMANIRFMSVDNPIRSLVFTSSIPDEGKSTVACNVGRAIATSGMRVCLVECDMRNRTLANMLGVRSSGGLYAVLSETMPLQQAIVPAGVDNMFLLDAEPHIPNPADILASKRFALLVDKLEQMFDYVIFDTPPVGMFVDAAVVSTIVDAAVLVVRENFTKRQTVLQAYDQLQKAGGHVVGVAMNYCNVEKSDYYYAYYNQQGKREKGAESVPQVDARQFAPEQARKSGKHGSHGGAANPANYGRMSNNGVRR